MPLSRMRWVRLARIIGVLLAAAALAACSALKLAYNNLPELSYWWLDGYLDFDGAQTPRVRDDLAELLAWHRRHELPRLVELLRGAQALAPEDITPAAGLRVRRPRSASGCSRWPAGRRPPAPAGPEPGRAPAAAAERKYAKNNAEYRKDGWSAARRAGRRSATSSSSSATRTSTAASSRPSASCCSSRWRSRASTPQAFDAERRRRQQEVLALLRRFQAERTPPAEARAAIHAYVLRIADPPPGPWRERQQALQQEGCRNVAALHNSTSAAQREQAVRRLQAYERDLGELFAAH